MTFNYMYCVAAGRAPSQRNCATSHHASKLKLTTLGCPFPSRLPPFLQVFLSIIRVRALCSISNCLRVPLVLTETCHVLELGQLWLILPVCGAVWRLDSEGRDTLQNFVSISRHFTYPNHPVVLHGISEGVHLVQLPSCAVWGF